MRVPLPYVCTIARDTNPSRVTRGSAPERDGTPSSGAVQKCLDEIRAAMARGELIEAYDHAERALADFPDDLTLRYTAVLVLGRSGATFRARSRYNAFKLGEAIRGPVNSALKVDIAALDARIAKDEALAAAGPSRRRLLGAAAERYERIFRETGASYPGINAATLWLLCGKQARSESLAREVMRICAAAGQGRGLDSYFTRATEAEAALILGELEVARGALGQAALNHRGDLSALANTRRQLKLICAARAISTVILAPLSAPSVIHYAGHVIGPRFPESEEVRVRKLISESMERLKVGFGYGSLAAGSDILFAEALLERDAELHVTIPVAKPEFKRISVAPSGARWLGRFEACLSASKTVTFATNDEYLGDEAVFGYADRIAMGLALLRARFLDAAVHQIAVWDGAPPNHNSDDGAGTATSVAFWLKRNLPHEVINPRPGPQPTSVRKSRRAVEPRLARIGARSICAILFCDVKGFGQLREAQLPIFEREILGRYARVLDRYRRHILFRNTWGDGLYVVASDAETAARCAVDLLEEMESFTPRDHGLPEHMGIRLGGHVGPVFRVRDPVLKRRNFVGSHVSRAAMIEPVTPEGAAYVTEAFAAELATNPASGFNCEYVGQLPAAKRYGIMRMYSLRRATAADGSTAAGAAAISSPPKAARRAETAIAFKPRPRRSLIR